MTHIMRIDEMLQIDGSNIIQDCLPIDNAKDLVDKLKVDGWDLDFNYTGNWTGGDFVTLLFRRGNERLWVEFDDKNGYYNGDNMEDILSKLKLINKSEYKK